MFNHSEGLSFLALRFSYQVHIALVNWWSVATLPRSLPAFGQGGVMSNLNAYFFMTIN